MDLKTLVSIPPWDWPKDAAAIFLNVLSDGNSEESDRLMAAKMGGEYVVMEDEIAEALLAILKSADEFEGLRSRAAISFGVALEQGDSFGFEDPDDLLLSEKMFDKVVFWLRELFFDVDVPREVRRRILEASVRAPQDWHGDAVRAAYHDDDKWRLTAVFCMRFIPGFDEQILEALKNHNKLILYEAVCAAGSRELDAAWPHIVRLATSEETEKKLRLTAIEAVAYIRPHEAEEAVGHLIDHDDEDIVEATFEAIAWNEEAEIP